VDHLDETVRGALRDLQDFVGNLQATLAGTATRESVEALGMRLAALEDRAKGSTPKSEAVASGSPPMERVLAELGAGPRSLAALRKATGLGEDALKEVLADLERDGLISSSVRGRYTMYQRKEEHDDA
jgi:DNA-binding transcriptional ArsR family regulator